MYLIQNGEMPKIRYGGIDIVGCKYGVIFVINQQVLV